MRRQSAVMAAWVLLAGVVPAASAQDLAQRVVAGADGRIAFHYDTRDGVLGCATHGWRMGSRSFFTHRDQGDGRGYDDCWVGPAFVLVDVRDGAVDAVKLMVAPRTAPRADRDLGEVAPAQAAEFLIRVAESGWGRDTREALSGAFIARDVEIWPRFLDIARDRQADSELRKQAMFWVSQEAAAQVLGPLRELAESEDEQTGVREAAVFALSQRPDEESVPTLMEVARTARDPEVRQAAFFWLAQKDDERVGAFFETLLRGG